jgi:two-component system chemotaxis response regulator CheY
MSERCALVIEDSPTMRQLITLALRRVPGLSFVECNNGAEALEHMQKRKFDVLLLDINMPVMGGMALLERLQGQPGRPPVIVISTESASEDKDRAKELGVVAYVTKPVRAPDLAATVSAVLSSHPA